MKLTSTNRNRAAREEATAQDRAMVRGTVVRSIPGAGAASVRRGLPGAPWRLPSGQLLVEYALNACFTGPSLLARFPYSAPISVPAATAEDANGQILTSLENLRSALSVAPDKTDTEKRTVQRKSRANGRELRKGQSKSGGRN